MKYEVIHGECLEAIRRIPSDSVDSLVTDPPAGISFMGRKWDSDKGGRTEWVAWLAEIMKEAVRVMKPGAHGVVWALPRTSHWTTTALEDAGFEIRDVITHLFSTGFPKSLNLEDGLGTSLKPASEHWILVRKPLSEKTVFANIERYGTGAINIDGCRISHNEEVKTRDIRGGMSSSFNSSPIKHTTTDLKPNGRWPANVLLSHTLFCVQIGEQKLPGVRRLVGEGTRKPGFYDIGAHAGNQKPCGPGYGGEIVYVWECPSDCAVRTLDEQSGQSTSSNWTGKRATMGYKGGGSETEMTGYGDAGGASRFFYVAKPSRSEKEAGLHDFGTATVGDGREIPADNAFQRGKTERKNTHPTIKSIALMSYLARLVTPIGGTLLDPFGGSGTTGVAALREGFTPILIEREEEFFRIAQARLLHESGKKESTQ